MHRIVFLYSFQDQKTLAAQNFSNSLTTKFRQELFLTIHSLIERYLKQFPKEDLAWTVVRI